ncbi:unnamed protein product [Prunus armeniaca]
MSNLRRVLERQHKEEEEIRCRRADEDREADEEMEEMLAATVCMFNQSRQHCRHRAPNVDIRRESQGKNLLEEYFIPNSLFHVSKFRERYRMQPHLFQKIMHDICNYDTYFIQKYDVVGVLGILPEQKLTAALRMLGYGASAKEYLRKPTPRDLQRLLQKAEARDFSGMIGSIDCMHWQWKNCPTA